MFRILFPIIVLIIVISLIRRFFAAFTKPTDQSESQNKSKNSPNAMVKDPVCGMYMDSRLAVRIDHSKEPIYFCSEECKKKYLKKSTGDGAGSAASL